MEKKEEIIDYCFICFKELPHWPRYPIRACNDCMKKTTSKNKRPVTFFNQDMGGGYIAYYSDNEKNEVYENHECYINGIKSWADEAYLDGIVVVPYYIGIERLR